METYSTEDKHYIAGFEAGCEYVVAEIERYAKEHGVFYGDLIAHLRCEEKKDAA